MKQNYVFFVIIIPAVCLASFASDIYAPSLPAIAKSFESSINQVQWSMSIYMLGMSSSQLIYGPLSEGIGRKIPLVIGLFIMLIGNILCINAKTIEIVILGRFIQGAGAGSCSALWRATFRDIFNGEELAKYSSYLIIFIIFIIPTAPIIGGYLQSYFDWYASFIFMSIYNILALTGVIFCFKETNKNYHILKLQREYVLSKYTILLKSPIFMGVTISVFLSYGAIFSWFVVGPVLLIEHLDIKPETFGWLSFFCTGFAYALAGWLNGKYVQQFGINKMMRFGWSIMIIAGIMMLVGKYMIGLNIWAIMIPVILFYFGSTFIWPNAFATAFNPFGHLAGYAGALYSFMQTCGAVILSGIIAYLPDKDQGIFALIMIFSSALAWLVYEISN